MQAKSILHSPTIAYMRAGVFFALIDIWHLIFTYRAASLFSVGRSSLCPIFSGSKGHRHIPKVYSEC